MQDIVTQRFIKCHDLLIEKGKARSSRQFAISLEYLPQSLSEILKGRRNATVELLRKTVEKYGVCPKFLFCGIGDPLGDESLSTSKDVLVVVADSLQNERILHVPYSAQAGYGGQLSNPQYISELPSFTLPDPYFQSGTFRSFDVSGDSMEPTIYENERLICSFMEKDGWHYSLKNNYVYVIITQEDIVVKRIVNHIEHKREIILHSDNDYYPPRSLPVEEIKEIWYPKLKISRFVSSPRHIRNSLFSEIDEMKETISAQNEMIKGLNLTIEKMLRQNRSR